MDMKAVELTGVMFKSCSTLAYLGERGRIGTGGDGFTGVVGQLDSLADIWRCGDGLRETAGVSGLLLVGGNSNSARLRFRVDLLLL